MGDGTLSLRYISGSWIVTKPDGSTLNISGSVTSGLQEAINEAVSSNYPLHAYRGASPIVCNNVSINVPASEDLCLFGYGLEINFINMGDKPGWIYDTHRYGGTYFKGSRTRYSGNGPLVLLRPGTEIIQKYLGWPYSGTLGRDHDFGLLEASGGSPRAIIELDVTRPSGLACNNFDFMGEGRLFAVRGIWLRPPADGGQVVAENTFRFKNIEACTRAAIEIGGGSFDNGLGTNLYFGNIAHAGTATDSAGIISNAPWDMYWLHSNNNYQGPSQYLVRFGGNARDNLMWTRQMYGGSIGQVLDQNADPSHPNLVGAPLPPPLPGNFEGTAGTPAGSINMATFTYVDRSWAVDNGKTVTKLWLNTTTPGSYPLKLVRRNSAGNYDVVASATIVHGGSGLEGVSITPYAVPSDGKQYYVGAYTAGVNHPALDLKDRALTTSNISGNSITLTEQAAQSQWFVLAVGVSYGS